MEDLMSSARHLPRDLLFALYQRAHGGGGGYGSGSGSTNTSSSNPSTTVSSSAYSSTSTSSAASSASSSAGHTSSTSSSSSTAMFAARLVKNEKTATYFAAAICGIIAIFTFLHWTRLLMNSRRWSHAFPAAVAKPFVVVSRKLRNLLVRGAPGVNSTGHGLLVALYAGINVALLFTNVDESSAGNVASRFGWVLMTNVCFLVFLALKNTPLAYLTAYSYERLNCLHQIAGCTTFLLLLVHAITYTVFFYKMDRMYIMREHEQIAGMIAGFMFLLMVSTAVMLRRFAYEVFYAMHITAFVISMVAVGFHRPEFASRLPIVTCLTAGLFAADRMIRLFRLAVNCTNNKARVYPLPNGGTRVLLAKKPWRAAPGKHVFLWVPHIRFFEMHPFTIIDTKPTEFVIKSYNGFTRRLHAYAEANPGGELWAAAEGSYGTFPDPMEYDKIILIAGGSGASYTFGLAVNMLERMDAKSAKNIVFIWTAKTEENLSWFSEHLNTLRTHRNAPKVDVSLFVTHVPGSSSSDDDTHRRHNGTYNSNRRSRHAGSDGHGSGSVGSSSAAIREEDDDGSETDHQYRHQRDIEKAMEEDEGTVVVEGHTAPMTRTRTRTMTMTSSNAVDIEKIPHTRSIRVPASDDAGGSSDTNGSESMPLRHAYSSGRPDAETVIRNAVSSTARSQRVLVAACGPAQLMTVARNATAKCITSDGPGVELHCEQFGW